MPGPAAARGGGVGWGGGRRGGALAKFRLEKHGVERGRAWSDVLEQVGGSHSRMVDGTVEIPLITQQHDQTEPRGNAGLGTARRIGDLTTTSLDLRLQLGDFKLTLESTRAGEGVTKAAVSAPNLRIAESKPGRFPPHRGRETTTLFDSLPDRRGQFDGFDLDPTSGPYAFSRNRALLKPKPNAVGDSTGEQLGSGEIRGGAPSSGVQQIGEAVEAEAGDVLRDGRSPDDAVASAERLIGEHRRGDE